MKKQFLTFLLFAVAINSLIAQDRKGYGLILPTEEQLKQLPYVPSFSLPPNFVLPPSKDLTNKMPPVGNQGYQGSCTAWSISYGLKSYQEEKQNNWLFVENGNVRYDRICSPSFVFNIGKKMLNNYNCLDGIPFALGFQILNNYGTNFLSEFPYDETNCTNLPSQQAITNASVNKISFAQAVNFQNLQEIKYNISVENPIVLGVALDDFFQPDGFDYYNTNRHYTFIPKGVLNNYHAMLCIGYNDVSQTFKVLNSWSDKWGNNGYVDIPYSWFPWVVKEAYSVSDAYSYNLFVSTNNKELETAQTKISFDNYSSWFKEGYFREYKNLRIGLTDLNLRDSSATVIYSDIDSNKTLNIVQYKLNTPTSFYIKDSKVTFTLTKIGKAGKNPFTKAAYFTVKIDKTVDKEFIDKLNNINIFKQQKDQFQNIKQLFQQQQQRPQ